MDDDFEIRTPDPDTSQDNTTLERDDKTDDFVDTDNLLPEDSTQISKWNSAVPPRVERCIHNLLRGWMASQPTATAISAWDGEMTYGQLDEASRRLAHHLVGHGVGPEVMVGLCMDKSKWAVVSMVGILRAGAAVVPLGVQHPLARIEGIVTETAARLILVDRTHGQRLSSLAANASLLAVDTFLDTAPLATTPALPIEPCTSVESDNVAWVIYTSGSTGTPKGVVLEHGALVTSILAHGSAFNIQPHDRHLQFAAHTFDVAISEIMATLSFGACICIPSEEDRMSRLTPFLSEKRVTIATLTSTIAALVQPSATPKLRTLVLMGEAVKREVVDQWIEHTTIFNAYGPSECCIHSTSTKILDSGNALNVGLPLAGALWVVDPANIDRLVSVGAPGELLIEGPLLARCYLNDSEKTAAAFVTDPTFVQHLNLSSGRRMYRTGDLVQQANDGSLTYIGRRDTQVQIRGQRVEIGEIESQIARLLPGQMHACVSYSEVPQKESRLIAVVGPTSPDRRASGTSTHSLINPSLKQQEVFKSVYDSLYNGLPRYMIPSVFLAIDSLPLNDNSKLDRRRVATLLASTPSDKWLEYTAKSEMYQSPVGAVEKRLCESWAICIGIEQTSVSRTDDFFHLGGDSVTAMKLVQLLQQHGLRLSVADVFHHPTLATMAALIVTDVDESAEYIRFSLVSPEERSMVLASLVSSASIEGEGDVLDILPTTDSQAEIVQANMEPARTQLNYLAFDADDSCDIAGLTSAISRLVASIESFRSAFVKTSDGKLLQVVYAGWRPSVQRFRINTNMDLDAFCQDIFGAPSLSRPMFEAAIIVANAGQHRIVFRISHALYDGSCLPLVWNALESIYVGQAPGKFVHVGSYVQSLQSRTTDETKTYWRELLRGATISSISSRTEPRMSRIGFVPGKPIMLAGSSRPNWTIAVAVKAAWALVLGQHINSRDVVFADMVSGRSAVHPSVADVVACCARAMPFRVTYSSEWTVQRLLEDIKEQQITSIRHEALEFKQVAQLCMGSLDTDRLVSVVNHQKVAKADLLLGAKLYKRVIVRPKNAHAPVDFAVSTIEGKDGLLQIHAVFAADRLSSELAAILVTRFRDLLEVVLTSPCCDIRQLLRETIGIKVDV